MRNPCGPGKSAPHAAFRPKSLGFRSATATLAFIWLALAVVPFSCARPDKAEEAQAQPGFAVPEEGLVLVLASDGRLVPADDEAMRAAERDAAPFAVRPAVASVTPMGDGALVLLNRLGPRFVSIQREAGGLFRVAVEPVPGAAGEFSGRTVGPSWSLEGDVIAFLYRHPFFETSVARKPSFAFLRFRMDGPTPEARLWSPFDGEIPGLPLYAVYPADPGRMYLQGRSEDGDRVSTDYYVLSIPGGGLDSLDRAGFELAVMPRPLSNAPSPMGTLAAMLAGDLVIGATLADGSLRPFVRGSLQGASQAIFRHGIESDILLAADGRLVLRLPDGRILGLTLQPPVPGSRFRDAAFCGGLLMVTWEEDLFPDTGRSGLILATPGKP